MSYVIDEGCDGCIYLIKGQRKDKAGYVIDFECCLCEEETSTGCVPTYEFPSSFLYEGEWIFKEGTSVYLHKGVLKETVKKVEL